MKKSELDNLKDLLVEELSVDYFGGLLSLKKTDNVTIETSDSLVKAINRFEDPAVEVSVTPWFDNFAVYMKIGCSFNEDNGINYFVSICFFIKQANKYDQLFRAEWDNFDANTSNHPQPHWHITSNQAIEKNLSDLENGDDNFGEYAKLFEEEKNTSQNVHKNPFCNGW